MFSVATKKFSGEYGLIKKLSLVDVVWEKNREGKWSMSEIPGSEREIQADLVLLAMGFEQVIKEGLLDDLGVGLTSRGTVAVSEDFMTSVDGVFAAGDSTRGASLVVWAIQEGWKAADAIDRYLKG